MKYEFDSRLGKQLYHLLPEVYRTRDRFPTQDMANRGNEDLARYLDAHGHLLDLIHATLEQQLKDLLPGSSQDWLLPYYAQLLAVNLVSPDAAGRHAEMRNAISWRQRKGTLRCAEEIAEAVGRMEAEIQEGWRRVALTPRVDMPLMPARVTDDTLEIDMGIPAEASRHPALPPAMVDLRRPSRAVEALAGNPAARVSRFGGVARTWRQQNRHGAPCFPGSFDDVSRRTVDLRSADARYGRYHHKRLLAYVAPATGLFPLEPIRLSWPDRLVSRYEHLIEDHRENGVRVIRNRTSRIVEIAGVVSLDSEINRIEGLRFTGEIIVEAGGRLDLFGVEAADIEVKTFSADEPVVSARDSLIGILTSAGAVQLDSCTVLGKASLNAIDARDSILMDVAGTDITGLVEYSRIPSRAPFSADEEDMVFKQETLDDPGFVAGQSRLDASAVLAPTAPESVYRGASDGGEMGYYHYGRAGRPVPLDPDGDGRHELVQPEDGGYPLADVIFPGEVVVTGGQLKLVRCAAAVVRVETALSFETNGSPRPTLDARDCLFDELGVVAGLARLEYCTVMRAARCRHLQASDCIFMREIGNGDGNGEPVSGCLRFSRIPLEFAGSSLSARTGRGGSNTRERPIFRQIDYCEDDGSFERRPPKFGEAGYGVLHPATPKSIRSGAEDGGEMGACHHKHYGLRIEAVLDKLEEFLPVGIEPVLIEDARLLKPPPEHRSGNGGTS